jgi:kynurenine formamidase
MILSVQISNHSYKINVNKLIDISIPLIFNGAQPNVYGVEKATAKACEAESLIGDTRRGGSCNFEEYKFIPHCNGTHTECVGHITNERITIQDSLKDTFIPATLVTVQPENALDSEDTYSVKFGNEDKLITKKMLENALRNTDENFLQGLIIRTLPNDESKRMRTYIENSSPYFSLEAMHFIAKKKVKHLLVDLPSIDRTFDEGRLSNHRIFWNLEEGSFQAVEQSLTYNTVTEMVFVPSFVKDGNYILNLQIAPFVSDASPSRPILFGVFE